MFTRSDACGAAETWARYMGKKQEDLQGLGVFGDPGVAEAIKQDALGIGFNNVNYAYDAETKKPMDALAVLPLDVNGNGTIDPEESFYENRDALTKAIANGRYPSPPARDLYLVSGGKPAKKRKVVEFLRWILSDGQAFVQEAGYVNLSDEAIQSQLQKLKEGKGSWTNEEAGCAKQYTDTPTVDGPDRRQTDGPADVGLRADRVCDGGRVVYQIAADPGNQAAGAICCFPPNGFPCGVSSASCRLSPDRSGVTGTAILIAIPLCLLTAIYLAEYAPRAVREWSRPLIDVLAGIPSVVYGVWGGAGDRALDTGYGGAAVWSRFQRGIAYWPAASCWR